MEYITQSQLDHNGLLRYHVYGCTVFVLEPKVQNDQTLSKWNRCSSVRQFPGFLNEHSYPISNV